MSEKHFVGMGYAVCPVCLTKHSETVILQTKDLNVPKLERENLTEFALCPNCADKTGEFLAVVEITNGDDMPQGLSMYDQQRFVHRTGHIVHIKREVARQLFNVQLPANLAFVWGSPDLFERLQQMAKGARA